MVTVQLCRCRRFRSITKQFFRKADGVVLMYDVTVEESFRAVKPWLTNVQVWPLTQEAPCDSPCVDLLPFICQTFLLVIGRKAQTVLIDIFCGKKGWTKSFNYCFSGSSRRGDPHPPLGQQNGHGWRTTGVIQRGWAAGLCEVLFKVSSFHFMCNDAA